MDNAFTHLLAMVSRILSDGTSGGTQALRAVPAGCSPRSYAVLARTNSYGAIHGFIDVHLHRLKADLRAELAACVGLCHGARDPSGCCGGRLRGRVPSARTDPERERRVPRHARGHLRRARRCAATSASSTSPGAAHLVESIRRRQRFGAVPSRDRRQVERDPLPATACSVNAGWPTSSGHAWMQLALSKKTFERAAHRGE